MYTFPPNTFNLSKHLAFNPHALGQLLHYLRELSTGNLKLVYSLPLTKNQSIEEWEPHTLTTSFVEPTKGACKRINRDKNN